MEVIGFGRCTDSPFTERKLAAYAAHPNVGGVLVVSNGNETIRGAIIAAAAGEKEPHARAYNQPRWRRRVVHPQGGSRWRRRCLRLKLNSTAPLTYADLVIGAECGRLGRDERPCSKSRRRTCIRPSVRPWRNSHVRRRCTEAVGLKDVLVSLLRHTEAAEQIACTYDKFFQFSEDTNQFFITPGNMRGGLTTIEERAWAP